MIVIDAQLGGAVGGEGEINTNIFDGDKPGAAFGPQFVVFQLFLGADSGSSFLSTGGREADMRGPGVSLVNISLWQKITRGKIEK